jgi:hypothetical protein
MTVSSKRSSRKGVLEREDIVARLRYWSAKKAAVPNTLQYPYHFVADDIFDQFGIRVDPKTVRETMKRINADIPWRRSPRTKK